MEPAPHLATHGQHDRPAGYRRGRPVTARALRIVDQHHLPMLTPTESYLWPPEPPPQEQTLLDLLERELGAHLIGA